VSKSDQISKYHTDKLYQ